MTARTHNLTKLEIFAMREVLRSVEETLKYDKEMERYIDTEPIIISLTKAEYQAIKRILKKT